MKLNAKLNVVMLAVFSVGLLVSGYLSYTILHANARKVVLDQATLLMNAATAVQGYTDEEIAPRLSPHMSREFVPQVVAAYAATQALGRLTADYTDYSYKEATLNPTNARDKAFEWEADIVNRFRDGQAERQIVGTRPTTDGESLYLARPIRITEQSCLACHGDPSEAPKSMLAQYGPANGFGWQLDEIVGARIVSVPLDASLEQASQAFVVFMSLLFVMFVTFIIVLNTMLKRLVIAPAGTMSEIADEVSKGNLDVPAFDARGEDEMATLAGSFNRMRRSLEKAMRMLDK